MVVTAGSVTVASMHHDPPAVLRGDKTPGSCTDDTSPVEIAPDRYTSPAEGFRHKSAAPESTFGLTPRLTP
jgi:hypothetical protein